ncbi:ABC transporter ATP-binding protein [Paludibacterium purpuratum]|uniref:Putative ABC transport system ATP-binding protein n=1 Tax=Paludibacterium purpuratum TaxID=1144873 RepID=A0A4R7B7Z3_9NEIS|nr:ABC transporter ATP-binding protein [Paludibacterium purpuratum]TDR80633.1 putative ABC transport system ATP-binding protein [Paludibacterium purpuratum]
MLSVEMHEVCKNYQLGQVAVPALQAVTLAIHPARFTVLSGPSGSGKTTLLNLIGAIDRPDQGSIEVAGQDILRLRDDALSAFRARHIGFVFQNFNLLPVLSAYENVEYPLLLAKVAPAERKRRVLHMLEAVGLADKARNLPGQLSGGQRQRVSIARALINKPALVLADEPTANLDSATGATILALLRTLQQQEQVAVVFSSHDPQVIAAADDLYTLLDGKIQQKREVRAKELA